MTEDKNNLSQTPKSWVWTNLREILDFVKGKKPKNLGAKNELLTIPYVNIRAFEKKVIDKFTDGTDSRLCETSDILIVWDGARCGLVGRGVSGAIGSTLAKLVCYELNPSYLFHYLRLKYDYINKRPRGVGIPHVDPNIFWNITMPLPPLVEQDRIVSKIEELFTRLDAGLESLRMVKTQLGRYRQAVLKHAFEGKLTERWRNAHKDQIEPVQAFLERMGEEQKKNTGGKPRESSPIDSSGLYELPTSWMWIKLGEVTESMKNGIYKPKRFYSDDGIACLRMYNIESGKIVWKDIKRMILTSEEVHAYELKAGDILVNRVNSRELVGKAAVIPKDLEICVYESKNIRLRLLGNFVDNKYVNFWLQIFRQKYFNRHAQQTVGMASINQEQLSSMPVPLSPLLEQRKIVEEIEHSFSIVDEIEKNVNHSMTQAEKLRQAVLRKAFWGKLALQDPTDEPAEKLLERIREEKEKRKSEEKGIKRKRKGRRRQMGLIRYVK